MAGHIGLTILGVFLALLIAPFAPLFDQVLSRWHYVEPTCEDPRGLKMLDLREEGVGTVEVSSGVKQDEESQSAMHAFDARPGSGWVPDTLSPRGDNNSLDAFDGPEDWMAVKFTNPQPVALVCVINGNASDWISYMRADRVRTVDVSLTGGEQERTHRTSLRTLPEHEIQNRQNLELPAAAGVWPTTPSYDGLKLTVSDRYTGISVDDPETAADIDYPTHKVMLAEVEVWVHARQ